MYLRALSLADFRSYAALDLDLAPGVLVFRGANGQGKTNLLEAVGFAAAQTSHRVATTAPLIRAGAQRAVIRVAVVRGDREARVELELSPAKATRARVNRAPVPRAREALGVLRTVLFAPEDLALVKGDPGERRRFLDDLLVARAPRFAGVRSDYERVLRQRTTLLKSAGPVRAGRHLDLDTLEVWNTSLARLGAELVLARLELVEALRPLVDKAYTEIAGGAAGLDLAYRSTVPDAVPGTESAGGAAGWVGTPGSVGGGSSVGGGGHGAPDAARRDPRGEITAAMLAEMARLATAERDRGVCLVGPHRDELALALGGLPARGYASQGESWSLALALRLASYELLRADGGEPVLLLDDVFAELDAARRERLAARVAGAEQVLLTAAVAADVPAELAASAVLDVGAGTVCRAG